MYHTKCNNESELTVKLTLDAQQRIDIDSSLAFVKKNDCLPSGPVYLSRRKTLNESRFRIRV